MAWWHVLPEQLSRDVLRFSIGMIWLYHHVHYWIHGTNLLMILMIDGIDTEFEVMAVTQETPKCHHNRGAADVVVTFWSVCGVTVMTGNGHQFLFYHGIIKLTLNYEMLSSQTASQLSEFKDQGHCKHWVTWPDCFATPSNHCDVTAGLVLLNYIDIFDKKMWQNIRWFKGIYNEKTMKIYC